MYAIIIWLHEDTACPSVIGPYHDEDKAFEDGNKIRQWAHRVNVTNIAAPESVLALKLSPA